jgi:hypothetical protein
MNIRYRVIGVEKVKEFVMSLPRGIKAEAMRAISEYIVGDERHGLKHDINYKYVPRRAIGKVSEAPAGYYSWRQFGYVHWALSHGVMKIGRANSPTLMSQSWKWEQKNSQWDRTEIKGALPFDRFPARHNRLAGWRHYTEVISTNITGAIQAGQRAVNEWLKSKKK